MPRIDVCKDAKFADLLAHMTDAELKAARVCVEQELLRRARLDYRVGDRIVLRVTTHLTFLLGKVFVVTSIRDADTLRAEELVGNRDDPTARTTRTGIRWQFKPSEIKKAKK